MSQPVKAFTFPNGMMIVFDENGQQVPDYQGPSDECLPKLRQDFPQCQVNPATWDGARISTSGDGDDMRLTAHWG